MLGQASRILFGSFCHQDPSILMIVDGQLVQLCPRCIGLHVGFLAALVAASLSFRRGLVLTRTGTRLLLVLAVASLAFDWGVGGRLGVYAPTAYSRLLTGLVCGSALAVLLSAYRTSLWRISVGAPTDAGTPAVAAVLLASAVAGSLLILYSGWSVLTTVCVAAVMTNVTVVLGTAVRMLRVRLRLARCATAPDAAYSEGGGG